ncbi:MAG: DUF177 domain-containing protein [Fimbriimonas ginsengisoli]|uniref:DUF177 domain-containing protein n=1 Tax=Fimbriimonas ginsengisoli TaxID=1005039 RepID=A0A931PVG4_FIMGI|nr:DUF177 domain-containing protein [Fimbriimonas ginsengisoli]
MKRDDLLDLNDVLQHPGRKVAVDISTELPQEEELDLVKPLEGYLEAVSTGNVLLISGKFAATAVLECSRCSGPLEQEIAFEVHEEFQVEGTPSSLNPKDFARVVADEPYPLFEGNQLMVEALLRQEFLIEMPVQALCDFGWDGPCPVAADRGIDRPKPPAPPILADLLHVEGGQV